MNLLNRIRARFTTKRAPAPNLEIVLGDITTQDVDAIVNAAKPSLLGGGGVDGAIHRAGGPTILRECRAIAAYLPGGELPTGEAVVTTAGRLPASMVVHTVGPRWSNNPVAVQQAEKLRACYTNSLQAAADNDARTVAFPLISSGVYGWPVHDAIRQAYAGIRASTADVDEVRLVLFDQATYLTACRLLGSD